MMCLDYNRSRRRAAEKVAEDELWDGLLSPRRGQKLQAQLLVPQRSWLTQREPLEKARVHPHVVLPREPRQPVAARPHP